MGRKNTIWGARHIDEGKEISRLQDLSRKKYGIQLTKIEASAIMARKSQRGSLNDSEFKELVGDLRGMTSLDKMKKGLF